MVVIKKTWVLFFCLELKKNCKDTAQIQTHKQIHCPFGKQQTPSSVVWVQLTKCNWLHSYELQCVKNTIHRFKKLFLVNNFNNTCSYIMYQAFFFTMPTTWKNQSLQAVWIKWVKKDMPENCIPLYFSWIHIWTYLYTSNLKLANTKISNLLCSWIC